ncbi:MAG: transcription antitermination factor NusB [Acidobacteria bacterium]|jgi:N utilization substance protein B|nr:transcription antitermination factor NusB [Acidobacteriota bacterium]
MGIRREGRELALTYLYQLDLQVERQEDIEAVIDKDRVGSERVRRFAKERVLGVWRNLAEIDKVISKHLLHWKLERLARTDRGLLRLAVYEMRFDPEVPAKVALNEALEIGRKFGGEESSRFLNGVLDAILHEV